MVARLDFIQSKFPILSSFITVSVLLALFSFPVFPPAYAQGPEVDNIVITDVTHVSFSVVWTAGEPSNCDLKVYSDSVGTQPLNDIVTMPMPVETGSVTIAEQAENNGVMKVRVTGLLPNTDYYFQTVTTSKGTGGKTYYPLLPPYSSVRTEFKSACSISRAGDLLPFSNDLIKIECFYPGETIPAEGTLLLAYGYGAHYPVSSFVGDGIALPFACVDPGNLFSVQSHENIFLPGNESLILVQYMGIHGFEVKRFGMPCNDLLSQFKAPLMKDTCTADFKGEGLVDSNDLSAFAQFLGVSDGLNPGSQPLWGDLDGDGDTDGMDIDIIARDYGNSGCPECP